MDRHHDARLELGTSSTWPRVRSRASRPSTAWAAVAPRQTSSRGRTSASSDAASGLRLGSRTNSACRGFAACPAVALAVLDGIRHVEAALVQAHFLEHLAEHPGRSDERPPRLVLRVAGLLPAEHQRRSATSLTENRLRGVAEEVAPRAAHGVPASRIELALARLDRRHGADGRRLFATARAPSAPWTAASAR